MDPQAILTDRLGGAIAGRAQGLDPQLSMQISSAAGRVDVRISASPPCLFSIAAIVSSQSVTVAGPYALSDVPRAIARFGEANHIGEVVITVAP